MDRIYIGGTYNNGVIENSIVEFSIDDIENIDMVSSISLVSDELAIDELNFTVRYSQYDAILISFIGYDAIAPETNPEHLLATNDSASVQLSSLEYGVVVWYFHDNTIFGKFFVKTITRVSRDRFSLKCISAIGLLDVLNHSGGLYTAETGTTVADLLSDIIGDIIPYTVDTMVANTRVYGWLPYDTKRKNLHQLLLAYSISIIKNTDGSMKFVFLNQTDVQEIPDNKIFLGGSVELSDTISELEVTEHSFIKTAADKSVTVFDNSAADQASNTLVVFSTAPVYNLVASSGLTIDESGVNYARVTGRGMITAKAYTHVTQVSNKRKLLENTVERNVKRVTDNTLITPLNGKNALERLFAYYTAHKTVNIDIISGTEKCGDQVSFKNPYGEADAGYIVELASTPSSFIKSRAKIITGYQARGFGNYYTKSVTLTGNGNFTIPSEASGKKILVTLVGGGQGSGSGTNGQRGGNGSIDEDGNNSKWGIGGKGGKAGAGGIGGKTFSFEISCDGTDANVGDVISYTCGVGGSYSSGRGAGSMGSDTVFGSRSSSEGVFSVTGVTNLLTGEVYGLRGHNGYDGGNGGGREDTQEDGQSVPNGSGGVAARGVKDRNDGRWWGGSGGGGAYRGSTRFANGGYGSDGPPYISGGCGVNAASPSAPNFGCGADGGSGGGGGGGGSFHIRVRGGFSFWGASAGGDAGTGAKGVKGGDGVIFVYY